jgi:hypothetical protein
MKPLPLFLFSAFIGIVTLSIILGDGTKTDVLPSQEQQALIEATLTVEEKTYSVSLPKGSSVYDLMVRAQETSDFQFRGQEFPGLGFFIQAINGLEQSPRLAKYWIYYINGKNAEIGISAYTVNNHDIISWRYEDEE